MKIPVALPAAYLAVVLLLTTGALLPGCADRGKGENVSAAPRLEERAGAKSAPTVLAAQSAGAAVADASRGGPAPVREVAAAAAPMSYAAKANQERGFAAMRSSAPAPGYVAASALPPAAPDPSLYIRNTYLGGGGERDRLEKLIESGVLVDGKRVKLEAFSRTYAQTFPIPTNEALSVSAATERGRIIEQGDRTFLQVGLQAARGEAARRPALNIALVIDCSGSMAGENKLEYAKQAALALVDRLRAGDVLSLVTFDNSARVLAPARAVTPTVKARLRNVITSLTAGSGTNIFDGLALGHREAARNADRENGVNLVLLLSDGQVTAGVRDPARFGALAAQSADRDVQTTTVGMGIAFNEDLMLGIARAGRGNYHFLKTGADTRTVFAKELDDLTQIVAKAVRLRIRLAPGVGLVRVLGADVLSAGETRQVKADEQTIDRRIADELGIRADRQNQKEEPGIKLLIPHFSRGDSHVVLLEVAVPPGRGERKMADVFLKYKDLVRRANRETQTAAVITYTPDRADMIASLNRGVKKNLLGFQTGEALVRAGALIGQNRPADALRALDERMVVLGVAAREWNDRDLDHDGQLLSRYKLVVAELGRNRQVARADDLGAYLQKSLTYGGYQRTR